MNMIFISYSWEYKNLVEEYSGFLKSQNESVWIDDEKIDLEMPLFNQIKIGIFTCDVFIQVVDSKMNISKWMEIEYNLACKYLKRENIYILPVSCLPGFKINNSPNKASPPTG